MLSGIEYIISRIDEFYRIKKDMDMSNFDKVKILNSIEMEIRKKINEYDLPTSIAIMKKYPKTIIWFDYDKYDLETLILIGKKVPKAIRYFPYDKKRIVSGKKNSKSDSNKTSNNNNNNVFVSYDGQKWSSLEEAKLRNNEIELNLTQSEKNYNVK